VIVWCQSLECCGFILVCPCCICVGGGKLVREYVHVNEEDAIFSTYL
jgi:hypothetical protein